QPRTPTLYTLSLHDALPIYVSILTRIARRIIGLCSLCPIDARVADVNSVNTHLESLPLSNHYRRGLIKTLLQNALAARLLVRWIPLRLWYRREIPSHPPGQSYDYYGRTTPYGRPAFR